MTTGTTVLRPVGAPDAPAEVWLLDVLDEAGPRDLAAVAPPAGWQAMAHGSSMNGTALVAGTGAGELALATEPHTRLRLLHHPWSGAARLTGAAGERDLALHGAQTTIVEVRADGARAEGTATDARDGTRRTLAPEAWLAEVAERRPAAVGLVHPDWRGVRAATEHQLTYVLAVPADPPEDDAEELAARLAEAGVPAVLSGGLPPGHRGLVRALHRRGVRVLVSWHATFLQHGEPVNREALLAAIELAREGVVERIGFTKAAMAGAFARAGVPSTTLLNDLRTVPRPAPAAGDRISRAGIWSVGAIWRKLPYAMLAACAELDPVPSVRASGSDHALAGLAELLGVPLEQQGAPVAREDMAAALAGCDVNLYVTLSECSPMLLLESLAAGRPCLVGPNTSHFDEDPFLYERLVAGEPDRHERIAAAMRRAHAERDAILEHVRGVWWPAHTERAQASVRDLVGAGPGELL